MKLRRVAYFPKVGLIEFVEREAPDAVNLQPSPEPIPDWDSVGYFKLILHREEVFGIRFPAHEIGSLTTPGKIQEALSGLGVLP